MAWIESHQELARHPKTKRLARLLGISLPAAVGHLHFLWWWAMDYAQDGDLSRFDALDIADAAGWEGDNLLAALLDSGFLESEGEAVRIHDWDEYAGRLIEKREQNKERKKRSRARHAPVTQTSQRQERDGRESHRATEPNQTIPNQTINNTATATSEKSENQESLYAAYKRVYQRDLTPYQTQQLGMYIDNEGFEESVIVRAIERSALKSGGLSLVLKILNDYAAAGAKTLAAATAVDDEFEARKGAKQAHETDRGSPGQRKDSETPGGSSQSAAKPGYYEQFPGLIENL